MLMWRFPAHTDITTMTAKELEADLVRMEVALKKILGVKPALFRPVRSQAVLMHRLILNSRWLLAVRKL